MNILVNCKGFIGDCLFAASLAKKLKEKYPGCHITYVLPVVQPKLLLENNPYIDAVGFSNAQFDMVINVPEVDQRYPATVYMQAMAGIEDQSTEFDVYTVREYDEAAKGRIFDIRDMSEQLCGKTRKAKLVAFQNNWAEKSFLFTKEEYERAVDVPNLGYGGAHRNTTHISNSLNNDPNIILINVGHQCGVTQHDPRASNADDFAHTASLIKYCDWFVGSEGGLSNLACAVGTKCIITTDFIWQLYGPKGVIKQIDDPQMGPAVYYPDAGHVHLDPYLTDDEVAQHIKQIIL